MSTDIKPRPVRVFENDLQREEFARTVYVLKAKPGALPANFLEPETWVHVPEHKLAQGDRVEVTAEDGSWWAEILVRSRKGVVVLLEMLREHHFDAIAGKEHEAYDAEYAGSKAKWRVMRKSDRTVMVDKLDTKSEAVAWIEENAKPALKAA